MPFSNFVHMRTRSLVPRLKITVIGLGTKLVHERNRELTSGQYAWLARSLPVVVGKAYEHHITSTAFSFPLATLKNSILTTSVK